MLKNLFVLLSVALAAALVNGQACKGGVARDLLPGTPVVFRNPSYPANFAAGLNCNWTINVAPEYRFHVVCSDISMTPTTDCSADVLTINGRKICSGPSFEAEWTGDKPLKVKLKTTTNTGRFTCNVTATAAPCKCGKVKNTPKDRFPFVALLKNNMGGIICGATIVSQRYALTTADCMYRLKAANLKLVVGRLSEGVTTEYQLEQIAARGTNPLSIYESDIALVRTTSPIVFGPDVGIACMPSRYVDDEYALLQGKDVVVAGWGPSNPADGKFKPVAAMTMKVVPQRKCHEEYPGSYRNHMCTDSYPKDRCSFLPGSAFYYQDPWDQRYSIVSMVSGNWTCDEKKMGFNMRISPFMANNGFILANAHGANFCNSTTW